MLMATALLFGYMAEQNCEQAPVLVNGVQQTGFVYWAVVGSAAFAVGILYWFVVLGGAVSLGYLARLTRWAFRMPRQ